MIEKKMKIIYCIYISDLLYIASDREKKREKKAKQSRVCLTHHPSTLSLSQKGMQYFISLYISSTYLTI